MAILVTGGAGFIGKQWAEWLAMNGNSVTVLDNLSGAPKPDFNNKIEFFKGDILNQKDLDAVFSNGKFERVDHLAAHPHVKESAGRPVEFFNNNSVGTFNLLESCRKYGVSHISFTSTSTVYGLAEKIPTPEDAPLLPISNYGSTKMAGEAMLMSYASTYGMRATIFRLANIVGPTATHGVIPDFVAKLKKNPKKLEILGNGTQKKSYLFIDDLLSGFEIALAKGGNKGVFVYNVGSEEQLTTLEIAKTVSREMGLTPEFRFSGKTRAGWIGDVPDMLLDVKKLKALGWQPKVRGKDIIKKCIRR